MLAALILLPIVEPVHLVEPGKDPVLPGMIGGFVFVDWRRLLEHKQLRFRFDILKTKK